MSTVRRSAALAAAVGTLAVALTACSGGGQAAAAGTSAPSTAPSTAASSAVAAGQPFGAGCAQLPASGPGSVAAGRGLPVVAAAAGDPVLSTLVAALQKAQLVDALDSTPGITLLAPADPAFGALPADRLHALLADTPRLTAVLTHHVLPGRLAPAQLAGTHTTVANDTVTISGSGTRFTISGDQTLSGRPATVTCGDVPTANATVYVVDQVLKPAGTG